MSIAISGSSITFPDQTQMSTATGGSFRNRIINGDMRIDQRNAGASFNVPGVAVSYTVDRWAAYEDTAGSISVQQSTDAPSGYSNSALITVGSPSGSLSSLQRAIFFQLIEGFNVSDLGFGTASARTITLSFWVKSSVAGQYSGSITNNLNRSYSFAYTIISSNTWEQKSVTISGDTSGTWATGNTAGMASVFSLGIGSSYAATPNVWTASDSNGATGSTNLLATNGATFYITGVQLEAGSSATEFERRPIGTELALCQRYCFVAPQNWAYAYGGSGGALVNFSTAAYFPVPMRITPVVSALSFTVVNCSSPAEAALISYRVSYFSFNSVAGFAAFGNNAGAIYNAEL